MQHRFSKTCPTLRENWYGNPDKNCMDRQGFGCLCNQPYEASHLQPSIKKPHSGTRRERNSLSVCSVVNRWNQWYQALRRTCTGPLPLLEVSMWCPCSPETWLVFKECTVGHGDLGETCSVSDDPILMFFPRTIRE